MHARLQKLLVIGLGLIALGGCFANLPQYGEARDSIPPLPRTQARIWVYEVPEAPMSLLGGYFLRAGAQTTYMPNSDRPICTYFDVDPGECELLFSDNLLAAIQFGSPEPVKIPRMRIAAGEERYVWLTFETTAVNFGNYRANLVDASEARGYLGRCQFVVPGNELR
jgi:hypothetical protein